MYIVPSFEYFFICSIDLILLAIIYYTLRYLIELIPLNPLKISKRAVFITGCDSGFGRALALKCARKGIPVYAGVYTIQGGESLEKESSNLQEQIKSVSLDVQSDKSVNEAAKFVEEDLQKHNRKLWALVNNAGMFGVYGPDAWTSIEKYRGCLEVNLFGVIRCTHAFLPLLKQSKGRLITTSSVAGRCGVMHGAPYSISKYAVESYMDAVRLELYPFGIECCILEPGVFRTTLIGAEMMRTRVNGAFDELSPEMKEEYGVEYKDNVIDNFNNHLEEMASNSIDWVVDSYFHAINARYPRFRYRCGWDCILFYIPYSFLPTGIADNFLRFIIMKKNLKPAAVSKPTTNKIN